MSADLFDAVFQVVKDWKNSQGFDLWPVDDLGAKRRTMELCFRHDLITLLTDSQGRLEGFFIFYRDFQFEGLSVSDPRPQGPFVVSDVLWIRPDLRGTDALKRLFKKAIKTQKEKLLGGEKMVWFRKWNNFNAVFYDFPKFFRKFSK